jgi:hypothetical protein
MNSFKRFIQIGERDYYVHFTKVFYTGDDKFFILVTGQHLILHFDMEKDSWRKWRIVSPAPGWIMNQQEMFSSFIEGTYKAVSTEV